MAERGGLPPAVGRRCLALLRSAPALGSNPRLAASSPVCLVRNATKFREVHRAKRLALREPERSPGIRLAGRPGLGDREPVRRKAQIPVRSGGDVWRRRRDSNPRYPSGYSGFQDRRHRPLGHPSASKLLPIRRTFALRFFLTGGSRTDRVVHHSMPVASPGARTPR